MHYDPCNRWHATSAGDEESIMTLRLGDTAPDFRAETTEGSISFHDYLGDSWGVLFSHPADFTPVCTTELGAVARLKPEFERRNVKVVGLSVDPIERHAEWVKDINDTQHTTVNFPIIADGERSVAETYDMIHPNSDDKTPCARSSSSIRTRSCG